MNESFAYAALNGPQFQNNIEVRIVQVDNGWIIARPAIISEFLRHAKIDQKLDESFYVPKTMIALNENECVKHFTEMIADLEKARSAIKSAKEYFNNLERVKPLA